MASWRPSLSRLQNGWQTEGDGNACLRGSCWQGSVRGASSQTLQSCRNEAELQGLGWSGTLRNTGRCCDRWGPVTLSARHGRDLSGGDLLRTCLITTFRTDTLRIVILSAAKNPRISSLFVSPRRSNLVVFKQVLSTTVLQNHRRRSASIRIAEKSWFWFNVPEKSDMTIDLTSHSL